MTDTLFTSQTPALPDVNEATPVSVANLCTVATAGTSANARFYGPATIGVGTYAADLYEMTGLSAGTLLGSASFVSPIGGVWNTAAWVGGPISLSTGKAYKIVLRTSAGRYAAQGTFWASQLVSGNITGIQDGANPVGLGAFANGTFVSGLIGVPPNANTFNSNGYWVDFDHTATVAGAAPNGLAIAFALGSPTAALGLTAAPAGLAVPVGLGQPTVALNRTAAPNGLAIPVAFGQPTVALNRTAAPNGLAIPISFGSPSVVGGVVPAGLAIPVAFGLPRAGPTALDRRPGSWYQYAAPLQFNYAEARREQAAGPIACPIDGEALEQLPDGRRHCPAGNFTWPAGRVRSSS